MPPSVAPSAAFGISDAERGPGPPPDITEAPRPAAALDIREAATTGVKDGAEMWTTATGLNRTARSGISTVRLADHVGMTINMTGPVTRLGGMGLEQYPGVASRRELNALGIDRHIVRAHLAARRWRRYGTAVVLHNGPMTRAQRERAMLINCGPRSLLTSFTATTVLGLRGWDRPEIHVLAPAGTRHPALPGLVLHRAVDWSQVDKDPDRRLHRLNAALLVAANSLSSPRSACGIIAAAVQQRLTTAAHLAAALEPIPNLKHRRLLSLALGDIEQGSHALSEIELARICRRHRLPAPTRQAIRVERSGRRRYLDAEWRRPDGSVLAVEIDGAIHLSVLSWIDDQLRQNEVVLAGTDLLRFPSIVLRTEEALVIDQLRRGLAL